MSEQETTAPRGNETIEIPVDAATMPHIPQPQRKPPSVVALLYNHVEWLQHDLIIVHTRLLDFQAQTTLALARLQEQSRFIWVALVCVALLLLINALLMGWVIHLLGMMIGHVR